MPVASSHPRQCCCASSVRRDRKRAVCERRTGLETQLRPHVGRVQPDELLKHASTQRRRPRDFVSSLTTSSGIQLRASIFGVRDGLNSDAQLGL